MLVSTHTGLRLLLPAGQPKRATAVDAAATPGLAGPGVIPAATESFPQVTCAPEPAYRRQRALTSPVPAALPWRAADPRFVFPHGESSASSPPV